MSKDTVFLHMSLTTAADAHGGRPMSVWRAATDPLTRIDAIAYAVGEAPPVVASSADAIIDAAQRVLRGHADAGAILVGHELDLPMMLLRERFDVEFEKPVDVSAYLRYHALHDSFDNARRLVGAEPPERPEHFIDVIRELARRVFADRVYMQRDAYIARRSAQENLRGIGLDLELAASLRKRMSADLLTLMQQLAREFPFLSTADLGDTDRVQQTCERRFGVTLPSVSRKNPDVALLRRQIPRLGALLDLIYRHRRLEAGLHELDKILTGPGRLFFPLEFFATHTGRFAPGGAAAGRVNVQGTPRGGTEGLDVFDEFRPIYCADETESWISCDLSAIDPRILAFIAEQQNLLDLFRAGEDPYIGFMGRVMPGVQIEKHGINKHLRQLGKKAVNGLGYGEGFDKFRADVLAEAPDTPEEQIRAAFDGFREVFPAIVRLRSQLMSALKTTMKSKDPRNITVVGKCVFRPLADLEATGVSVAIELPTQRCLYYRSITSKEEYRTIGGQPKRVMVLRYAPWLSLKPATSPKAPSQVREELRASTIINNIVQSIARDIVLAQWQEIERDHPELHVRLHNQDELIVACARCTCPRRNEPVPHGKTVDTNHEVGCPWISGRAVVREVMSRVPACFPKLRELPLACELSDRVRDAWGK